MPFDPDLFIEIKNEPEQITGAATQVRTFLEQRGASQETLYAIDMAIEELVTNIIKYGFDDTNTHSIQISVTVASDYVILGIMDDGHFFDPTAAPAPDLSLSLEEMPIGGLGLHLVRTMVDEMHYDRVAERNHVQIRIGLEGKRSPSPE